MSRGLSLIQPWASLIACGAKAVETRSWKTAYRGPVLIHASKGFPKDCQRFALAERALLGCLPHELPCAAVVARALLVNCRATDEADFFGEASDQERRLGDWSPGRYCFYLSNVERLAEPIPWSGCLGLWSVPEELLRRVEAQLGKK